MDIFISRTTLFTLIIFILLTSSDYLRSLGHILWADFFFCLLIGLFVAYGLAILESQGGNNDTK